MCNSTVKNIAKRWKADALQEKIDYFYSYAEVDSVLSGDYCIVIGRKGSGKSALSKYVVQQESVNHDVFTESLSFKSFSFKELHNYGENLEMNNYISLWKYLIFMKVCKMFVRNENVHIENRVQLGELLPKYSPIELKKEINSWKPSAFVFKLVDTFGKASLLDAKIDFQNITKENNLDLEDKAEIIENVVLGCCDKETTYYLVFDELDEEYRNIKNLVVGNHYHDLLISLLRTIIYVKTVAEEYNLKIRPIVFLRDDIFNRLQFSDKNKWYDNMLYLEWTPEKLKELITHRIAQDNPKIAESLEFAFSNIFAKEIEPNAIFKALLSLSQYRPRDLITIIKECCSIANAKDIDSIDIGMMKVAEQAYSKRLKQEIKDEIHTILQDCDDVFALLTELTREFSYKDFKSKLGKYKFMKKLQWAKAKQLIELLFDYSVIGNFNWISRRPLESYKYMDPDLQINYDANFVVHPGLIYNLLRVSVIEERLKKYSSLAYDEPEDAD